MSQQIDTAFVKEFNSNLRMLLQQEPSQLRGLVSEVPMNSEMMSTDQVGVVSMVERTTRHADTPLVETPHARRWMAMADYENADLVDTFDKVRLKVDPSSKYMTAQVAAMNRKYDQVVIAALGASALTGKAGTTSTSLPATQIIQATGIDTANSGGSSTNLTTGKIRRAEMLLSDSHVPSTNRVFIAGAKQKQHLLRSTKATSADYNSIRALVNGEIDTWLGFKFVWFGNAITEMLPVAANIRDCYAFHRDGIEVGMGQMVGRIDQRADKSYSWQIYTALSMAATRLEEGRVVKVQCDETDTVAPE